MKPLYMQNLAPLMPNAFLPLPLGAVKPLGWLKQQLRIQSEGLSGHIDEFWPDLSSNSAWLGGSGEGWERGPYYLDGLVPLAYLLEDKILINKAQRWLDWALENQHADGWLGPAQDFTDTRRLPYDPWPVFVMCKALTQYQEASGDTRVIPALQRFFSRLQRLLAQETPLYSWAMFRWGDLLLSLIWLYNRTGDANLLKLAKLAHQQGYDWSDHFTNFRYHEKTQGVFDLPTHVVNNAMAVKAPGICSLISGTSSDHQASLEALLNLDRYHGQITGIFSGDEHLASHEPIQGTELCAVVEFMFSLENLFAIYGDTALADRLERVAFNALPATFSPDMWAHQYDQQVNQVLCTLAKRNWCNNGDAANLFGLEPNYGCCTANMHQGWPKFTANLWMAAADGGLVTAAYAPCQVTANVVDGQQVTITEETDYPFGESIRLTINCAAPVSFPLTLRVPAWCPQAILEYSDGSKESQPSGMLFTINRLWQPGESFTLHLPMPLKVSERIHSAIAVERGPLVYSLKIGEKWRQLHGVLPHADWEVLPTSSWNYALEIDKNNPECSLHIERKGVGAVPFSPEGAPIYLKVKGRLLPQWTLKDNSAAPAPQSPVSSTEPLEELTLIPYGCTNLRVTEFPVLAED